MLYFAILVAAVEAIYLLMKSQRIIELEGELGAANYTIKNLEEELENAKKTVRTTTRKRNK